MNLSIVEDISMECITGEIDLLTILQDIRTVLPLTGLERLELKLHTLVLQKTELIQAKNKTTHFIFTR